jgi:hypothetical protein
MGEERRGVQLCTVCERVFAVDRVPIRGREEGGVMMFSLRNVSFLLNP